jgi:hypothetical protein
MRIPFHFVQKSKKRKGNADGSVQQATAALQGLQSKQWTIRAQA